MSDPWSDFSREDLCELATRLTADVQKQDADLAALRAENERLRKDAERYRWLRGDTCPDHSIRWTQWEVRRWDAPFWTMDLRRNELDAAIDAAIAKDDTHGNG